MLLTFAHLRNKKNYKPYQETLFTKILNFSFIFVPFSPLLHSLIFIMKSFHVKVAQFFTKGKNNLFKLSISNVVEERRHLSANPSVI